MRHEFGELLWLMARSERLVSALFATNWNKSRTAARLHWSRMTIYRKMAKYQLMPPVPKT